MGSHAGGGELLHAFSRQVRLGSSAGSSRRRARIFSGASRLSAARLERLRRRGELNEEPSLITNLPGRLDRRPDASSSHTTCRT